LRGFEVKKKEGKKERRIEGQKEGRRGELSISGGKGAPAVPVFGEFIR
jgi:hypothetical protein